MEPCAATLRGNPSSHPLAQAKQYLVSSAAFCWPESDHLLSDDQLPNLVAIQPPSHRPRNLIPYPNIDGASLSATTRIPSIATREIVIHILPRSQKLAGPTPTTACIQGKVTVQVVITTIREGMVPHRDNGARRLQDNGDPLHNKATAVIKVLRNSSTITNSNNTTRPSSNITNNSINNLHHSNNTTNNHTVSLTRVVLCRKVSNASAMALPMNTPSNTPTVPENERLC